MLPLTIIAYLLAAVFWQVEITGGGLLGDDKDRKSEAQSRVSLLILAFPCMTTA